MRSKRSFRSCRRSRSWVQAGSAYIVRVPRHHTRRTGQWPMLQARRRSPANRLRRACATIRASSTCAGIRCSELSSGLDLVFIGPGDLATSMGLKGRADDPAVLEAIRQLELIILPSPVMLGGVAHTVDQANAMIARGYKALVVGFDCHYSSGAFPTPYPVSRLKVKLTSAAAVGDRRQRVEDESVECAVAASGSSRPKAGADGAETIATKRPFTACGKLTLPLDESSQNTGSARV